MATLATVDQVQYYFDPKGIVALSDHDPSTGQAVTCVYGISAQYLKTAEGVQQLMARLKIANNFGQLTRTDGSPIWISCSAVTSIRSRVASDPAAVNAVVVAGPITQSIRDAPDIAATKLQVPS